MRPIVEQMGLWARHWSTRGLLDQDLDDALLVWGLHRTLRVPPAFGRRVVLRFDFYGLPRRARVARRSWWLVAHASEVEICLKDPGFETDAQVSADLRSFTEVLLGDRSLRAAQREGLIRLQGERAVVRALPQWLPLNGEALTTLGIAPGTPVPGKARAAA